jgi:CRP-like cAMP-binding protein
VGSTESSTLSVEVRMSNQFHLFDSASNPVSYAAGQVIFAIGDGGENMYALQEGEVDITYNDMVIETVTNGGIFGEMAIVDDSPRSANAVARTDCKIVPVNQKQFVFMVQNSPFFAITVMRIMSERLRKLDRLSSEKSS